MVYLAISCAVVAVFLFTIVLFVYVKSASTQLSGIDSTSFSATSKHHLLWRVSKKLGDPFQPAVTWGQRRRISIHLERAGLSDWTFSQVYFLQCVSALLCLTVALWCLLSALIAFRATAFFALIASGCCGWCRYVWKKGLLA